MNEWAAGVFALGGVVIGGLGNWLLSRWQHVANLKVQRQRAERELLASLLHALNESVEAYTNVIAARGAARQEASSALNRPLRAQLIISEQVRDEEIRRLSNELIQELRKAFDLKPLDERTKVESKEAHEKAQLVGRLSTDLIVEIGTRMRGL